MSAPASKSARATVSAVVGVRAGVLAVGGLEVISEAFDVAGAPDALRIVLIGDGCDAAVGVVHEAGFADVAIVTGELDRFAPARAAQALAEVLGTDAVILLPASNDGRDLAPRLAARLDRPLIAGAVAVGEREATVTRAGGRALGRVERNGPVVATLQPGVRAVSRRTPRAVAPVEAIPAFGAFANVLDVEVLEVLPPQAATMDLADAPFIVGAGAGVGSAADFDRLTEVATRLDASVGATRVVTDAGWTTHDRQIGTTGVVVDPRVYVAFGVSGAVQHTSGLGTPDHVVSINTDPHCPMMAMADLAIVADAAAVIAALAERLDTGPADNPGTGDRAVAPKSEEPNR